MRSSSYTRDWSLTQPTEIECDGQIMVPTRIYPEVIGMMIVLAAFAAFLQEQSLLASVVLGIVILRFRILTQVYEVKKK